VPIPSYDDLTPSIPDVLPNDVLSSVAAMLPRRGAETLRLTPDAVAPRSSTFANATALRPAQGRREPCRTTADESDPGVAGTVPRELYAALHDAAGTSLERLLTIARDFSPRIERHPGGTVVLDIAGLQRLFGGAASIGEHLARAGAARVGIAATQISAVLLARTYEGVRIGADPGTALRDVPLTVLHRLAEDREAASMRPRPVRGFDVLRRWGLETLGELAALPAAALSARLGAGGVALQRQARGVDSRPLVPDPAVRRFIESCELEWPIDTLEPLSFVFARLLDPLAAALERADRGAIALHLRLRLTDRTSHQRTLALPVAMRDPRVLRTLLLLDLETHPPAAAVDVVTLEVDPAPGRVVQYSLLERPVPSPETLATLMARLGALVGDTRCGSPRLLDTYRPDGWILTPVAFDDSPSPPGYRPGATSQQALPPPMVLRRFRPPVAVRVAVEAGRPVRLAIDRRGMPGGAVQEAAGPWRAAGGWWDPQRWNRDEWDVALDGGAVCRLFQDRETGQWFADGVYD
jgi:protein ImuB